MYTPVAAQEMHADVPSDPPRVDTSLTHRRGELERVPTASSRTVGTPERYLWSSSRQTTDENIVDPDVITELPYVGTGPVLFQRLFYSPLSTAESRVETQTGRRTEEGKSGGGDRGWSRRRTHVHRVSFTLIHTTPGPRLNRFHKTTTIDAEIVNP